MNHTKRTHALALAISLFFVACDSGDDAANSFALLTLEVDASYTEGIDNWIFISDPAGELLDVKQFSKGETITLSAAKDVDKFNVTFFQVTDLYDVKQLLFRTFTQIDRNTTLKLDLPDVPEQNTGGTIARMKIQIANYEDATGTLQFSGSHGSTYSDASGTRTFEFLAKQTPSDILISGYRLGSPVYSWAKGTQENVLVMQDFSDFTEYPKLIHLDFPGVNSGYITAYNDDLSDPYPLCDTRRSELDAPDHPVLGYMDGFHRYEMFVKNVTASGTVQYNRSGSVVNTDFTMPTYSFTAKSKALNDFAFDFSLDYTYFYAGWEYETGDNKVIWFVYSLADFAVASSFPSEIVAKYPQLDFSKLKYSSCNFFQRLDQVRYPDVVTGLVVPRKNFSSEYYYIAPSN
ncbi:hypothetical protein [Chryseolinea soli]|uniref:Uncharacterized protein n=1 Tax=Chryseolinea soli TaxID=2321403 RepID=A0A385SJ62_9BACT|nr:hypothetical protein [Chryseolinea soli]AYB31289.1 hypothetical protein D4L85_12185 [Chryseolinea soli]